jgi:hypothetical protein
MQLGIQGGGSIMGTAPGTQEGDNDSIMGSIPDGR